MAQRAGSTILAVCTGAPALGLTINLVNPAEHNYYAPQIALLAAGLVSLYAAWCWGSMVGLGFYGSLSLLGLLLMFIEHARTGDDWLVLVVFLPSFGVLIVGCCIQSAGAVIAQAAVVAVGNLLTGIIYDNLSGLFSLWLATVIMTVLALRMCRDKHEAMRREGATWARWQVASVERDRLAEKLMDGSD